MRPPLLFIVLLISSFLFGQSIPIQFINKLTPVRDETNNVEEIILQSNHEIIHKIGNQVIAQELEEYETELNSNNESEFQNNEEKKDSFKIHRNEYNKDNGSLLDEKIVKDLYMYEVRRYKTSQIMGKLMNIKNDKPNSSNDSNLNKLLGYWKKI